MSRYYGVCAVTQRPIKENENVFFVVIKRNNHSDNKDVRPSYVGSFWKIISMPLKAKYNGDGFIKDIHLDSIKDYEIFCNRYKLGNLENFELITRGRSDNKKAEGQYAFMLVHADVISAAEKYPEFDKQFANRIWKMFKESTINAGKEAVKGFSLDKEKQEQMRKILIQHSGYPEEIHSVLLKAVENSNVENFLYTMLGCYDFSVRSETLSIFDELEDIDSFDFESIYNLGVISHIMKNARKLIQPQAGFGSQEYNDSKSYNVIIDVLKNIENFKR